MKAFLFWAAERFYGFVPAHSPLRFYMVIFGAISMMVSSAKPQNSTPAPPNSLSGSPAAPTQTIVSQSTPPSLEQRVTELTETIKSLSLDQRITELKKIIKALPLDQRATELTQAIKSLKPEPGAWWLVPLIQFFGFAVAAVGIFIGAKNLEGAKRSLESTTVYNIQKDSRELLVALKNDPSLWNYLTKHDQTAQYTSELLQKADGQITILIQFFSSVYNQRRNKVISDTFWDSLEGEIHGVLNLPPVKTFWQSKVISGQYNQDFKNFGNECIGYKEPSTGG
jgi:hypothetical protein